MLNNFDMMSTFLEKRWPRSSQHTPVLQTFTLTLSLGSMVVYLMRETWAWQKQKL